MCYHSFMDNDINYEPSMKNVPSFHILDLSQERFTPQSDTECTLNPYS